MEIIVLVATGVWIALVFVVISLCRAAKWSDEAMDAALAQAISESAAGDQTLRTLDLDHAAAALGVRPETLLAWEARYGFPTSSAADRRYSQPDVLALRDGLAGGASVAAAVAQARQRGRRRSRTTRAWPGEHRDGGIAS